MSSLAAICEAITAIRQPGSSKGASRTAIKKHLGDSVSVARVNLALRRGVESGKLVQIKESFKVAKAAPKAKKAAPKAKKAAPKKKKAAPKAKKAAPKKKKAAPKKKTAKKPKKKTTKKKTTKRK